MTTTHKPKKPAVWPIWVLAVPAGVAIWAGWVELGRLCGFGLVRPLPGIADDFTIDSSITLPIGVEAYAALALSTALNPSTPHAARKFAKRSAIFALILGMAGQVAYHIMAAAGYTHAPWWITAVVACLPVLVLGAGAALSHLLMHDDSVDDTSAAPVGAKAVEPQRIVASPPADTTANTTPKTPTHTTPTTTPKPQPKPQRRRKKTASTSTVPAGGKSAHARRVAAEHPDWTHQQIATEVGCTVRTVGRALTDKDQQPAPPELKHPEPNKQDLDTTVFESPLGPIHEKTDTRPVLEVVQA